MPKPPKVVSDYFRQIAEEGGYPSQGGMARAEALSPERRREIAKAAAKASAAVRAKKAAKAAPKKKAAKSAKAAKKAGGKKNG